MSRRKPLPTLEQLRAEYERAAKTDQARALINMKVRASKYKERRGVPDAENPALALIRELGVLAADRDRHPELTRRGYKDCVAWSRMPENARAVLERFVIFTAGSLPHKASSDQLQKFLDRPERPKYAQRQRDYEFHRLRAIASALDPKHVHPFFRPKHATWIRIEECAAKVRREDAALERYCIRSELTRATAAGHHNRHKRMVRYLRARKIEARGIVATIWPRAGIERLCNWWFAPDERGQLQSEYEVPSFFYAVRTILEANGKKPQQVEERIRVAKRAFRRGGRDHGKLNLIQTRPPEPPPAPSDGQVKQGYQAFADEIASLRAVWPEKQHRLADVLEERNMTIICHRLACRLSSIASLRYDQLMRDPETGDVYFANVVVKPNRNRTKNLTDERIINRRGYARWYLDPSLLPLLHEAGLARGIDVRGWLNTRDPNCLKWVSVPTSVVMRGRRKLDPADPFGEIAMGTQVAPVWFGPNDSYLRVGGVNNQIVASLRTRFKVMRGGAHVWRRRAVLETEELAVKSGLALERLHHMTPETRRLYRVGKDYEMKKLFPNSISVDAFLAGAEGAPSPATPAPAKMATDHRMRTQPRHGRRPRLAVVTASDILGRRAR